MTSEQLDALNLAVKVIFAGPTGTFPLDDHTKLQRASGLDRYIHECARAVVVDSIAKQGFFAVRRRRKAVRLSTARRSK